MAVVGRVRGGGRRVGRPGPTLPFLVRLIAGGYLGAIAVLLLVLLAIADGSLLAHLGRAHEDDAGTDLLKAPGVLAVISGGSFAHRDVDHVALATGAVSPSRSSPPSDAVAT